MNRRFRSFAVLLFTLLSVAAVVPAATAQPVPMIPELTGIRVGRHATFDRVVLDLRGGRPEFFVHQVPQLIADGSGMPVFVPGNYFLEVRMSPAAAHDLNGNTTYTGSRNFPTPSLTNVRGVAITGDYEANLTVGLGSSNDRWHRVFILDAPTRVVIDIGH